MLLLPASCLRIHQSHAPLQEAQASLTCISPSGVGVYIHTHEAGKLVPRSVSSVLQASGCILYTVTRCILGFHGWGVEIASCRFKIQDHARCRCGAHHQPPLRSIKSADAGFDADPFTNLWAVAASYENSRAIEGWSKCNAHGAGELSRFSCSQTFPDLQSLISPALNLTKDPKPRQPSIHLLHLNRFG